MSELLGKYYDKETTKLFESVVNKLLRKKYQWFDRIIINKLSYSKSQNYLGIDADLFADEDWVGNQWREFYYSKPMPSGTEDDPIVLGEMIGNELSKELQDDFKTVFVFITSEIRPKYMSHSWIVVKPIEMNDKKLQESIRRILREETELPAYIRRRVTANDLEWLVKDVKISLSGGKNKSDALYDAIQNLISSNRELLKDYDAFQDVYAFDEPLIKYINSRLDDEPLNESIGDC